MKLHNSIRYFLVLLPAGQILREKVVQDGYDIGCQYGLAD